MTQQRSIDETDYRGMTNGEVQLCLGVLIIEKTIIRPSSDELNTARLALEEVRS